jgi:hypothetical protein
VEGSLCIKVSKGNIIIKAHYKGESPLKELSSVITTLESAETWSWHVSFSPSAIIRVILSFDSSVRRFFFAKIAVEKYLEWILVLIF